MHMSIKVTHYLTFHHLNFFWPSSTHLDPCFQVFLQTEFLTEFPNKFAQILNVSTLIIVVDFIDNLNTAAITISPNYCCFSDIYTLQ